MFGFNLQALLDARSTVEEMRQLELAEAERNLEVQQGIFIDIQNRHRQMVREYYALEGKPIESLRLFLYSENIVLYRGMEVAQQEKCREANRKVAEKRLALIEASKQKKMLEKYKEKKTVEYLKEESKKESKKIR